MSNDIPDKRVEYRGTGFYVGLAVILVFAVALLILAVQNTQMVTVAFFGLEFSVPLFGVAIGAGILAVVLDELVGLVWRRQRRGRLQEKAELDSLRSARAVVVPETKGASDVPTGDTPKRAPGPDSSETGSNGTGGEDERSGSTGLL